MKTQEEYAREIDKIVIRDLDTCRNDWFEVNKRYLCDQKMKIRHLFWEPGRPDVI